VEQKEWVNTKLIEQLVGDLGARSVFGEPTREHGAVVIPVAQVVIGIGYGGGYGEGPAKPGGETKKAEGGGGGGGAGAGGRVTPRGYIRITPEGVKYEPIPERGGDPCGRHRDGGLVRVLDHRDGALYRQDGRQDQAGATQVEQRSQCLRQLEKRLSESA
jgi:uncharacterized spore protein YtfJ